MMGGILLLIRVESRVEVLNLAYMLELLGDQKQRQQNETKQYLDLSQNKLNKNLWGEVWASVCF